MIRATLLIVLLSRMLPASAQVDSMRCGDIYRIKLITSIMGLEVSQEMIDELNLQKKQIKKRKRRILHECVRVFDHKTGILLYGDRDCVDTVLLVYMLKSDVILNGRILKRRNEKIISLTNIEPENIASIRNIPPGEAYNNENNKKGILLINTK